MHSCVYYIIMHVLCISVGLCKGTAYVVHKATHSGQSCTVVEPVTGVICRGVTQT